jgi:hypothetical protein
LRLQHLQRGLGGAKDVKLLGRETDVLDQYRMHNAQSARVSQLQTTLQQFPRLHCWTGRGETMLKVSQECSDASA